MNLTLIGHDDLYAVEQLQLALFSVDAPGEAESRLCRGSTWLTAVSVITVNGKRSRAVRRLRAGLETVSARRRVLQQSFYLAALPHLPKPPAWGALSGVRPTKLTTRQLLEGATPAGAQKSMERDYFVTPERSRLAVDCSLSSVRAAGLAQPRDLSLYIGIPFCPTRCSYCSFVSRTVGKRTELIEPYLQALKQELAVTAGLMRQYGLSVRTVYIGGGTPTTLSTGQLMDLLESVREQFDLSRCLEFTVEGGRPDTLDAEKLRAIARCGADRMSINPQTMDDGVLHACGRPHTAQAVVRAYGQAREAGFAAINMDLIAGLPTDSYEGFCRSLEQVAALGPENITVHTLALKKGADLFESRGALSDSQTVEAMVAYANRRLRALGYKPYYLYRQKYMSGSFENVGWSRDGADCLYNIYMMEELHTIVSLGGGGMNKVNLPGGRLQRFHNPKFPEQYIQQLQSVLQQKHELFALMKQA